MTILHHNEVIVFPNSFLARASPVFLGVNLFDHFVAARAPLPLPMVHGRKLITANSSLQTLRATLRATINPLLLPHQQ